jgi:alpha-beta hydrolase superfamily lysophospholipase
MSKERAMIEKISLCVPSSDGVHSLSGVVYLPEGEVKGFFHVVHGMTEHIERYDKFLYDMASNGWISFGYDHLGHGKTAKNDGELGYIAKNNGWELLVNDVKAYSDEARKKYGSEDMPYILMGHSMGSFVARLAAQGCVKPQRLIIMGTGGPNAAADVGLALIALIKKLYGDKHYSPLIDGIAFGSYNKRFGGGSESDPKPWLTTDEEVRHRYYADKYCTFNFTVSAMGDLIKLIKHSNSKKWFSEVPSKMPILLVSGNDDPVGNYGKGVSKVEALLKKQGKDASIKLYSGARHEILNDFTYDEVLCDILDFSKIK